MTSARGHPFRTAASLWMSKRRAAVRVEPCPLCGAALHALDEGQRQVHVNRCLEKQPADVAGGAAAGAAGSRKKARAAPMPPPSAAEGQRPENNVAGYAARLRQDVDYGVCGLKEMRESQRAVERKVVRLAELLRQHKGRVWCCTGAGISTSAGLPDFRGPHGIWTKQQQESGKLKRNASGSGAAPRLASSFGAVKPSLTHHALTALVKAGYINHIATQNVDGLHRRAGAPLNKLSELHGNVCLEVCPECRAEFHRADDVGGVGLQPTGRKCDPTFALQIVSSYKIDQPSLRRCDGCGGMLRDHVLDWDDALPKDHVRRTERRARKATMSIALGTSLRIKPVGDMPVRGG